MHVFIKDSDVRLLPTWHLACFLIRDMKTINPSPLFLGILLTASLTLSPQWAFSQTKELIVTERTMSYQALPVCGNLRIESPETCDDGNIISNDGCSSTCQTELQIVQTQQVIMYQAEQPTYTIGVIAVPLSYCSDPAKNGMACDDQDACTQGESCQNGLCTPKSGTPIDDNDLCTIDNCDPKAGISHTLDTSKGYLCTAKDAGCDPTTCKWAAPKCKVVCDPAVAKGDQANCKIRYINGPSFTCSTGPHQDVAIYASYETATKTPASSASYDQMMTFSGVTDQTTTTASTGIKYAYAKIGTSAPISQGDYTTDPVNAISDISCVVMGQGGASAPCVATVEPSACVVNCALSNVDRKTKVGLEASCQLTESPSGSQCSYTMNGGTNSIVIGDGGVLTVPTDNSGKVSYAVTCAGDGIPKVQCKDSIDVEPVCNKIKVSVIGTDGEATEAHMGDGLSIGIDGAGFKTCAVKANSAIYTYPNSTPEEPIEFKVSENGYQIKAVCTGGDGLTTECPGVKISVAPVTCGNKVVEPGEECDAVSDTCIACKKHVPVCGDQIIQKDLGEDCDLGKGVNGAQGQACNIECRAVGCGDHYVQPWIGEKCEAKDASGTIDKNCDPDVCIPYCGNGNEDKDRGEACDPAKKYEGKFCKTDCSAFKPYCGDGTVNQTTEECDGGTECAANCKKIQALETPPAPAADAITASPAAEVASTPPVAVEMAVLPTDDCLDKGPKDSLEYQCCKTASGPTAATQQDPAIKALSYQASFFNEDIYDCCINKQIPVHPDGNYTTEDQQQCSCYHEPRNAACFSCFGQQAIDHITACYAQTDRLKAATLAVDYYRVPGRAILTRAFAKRTQETPLNLCSCQSLQPLADTTCNQNAFSDPLGLACYNHEQIDDLTTKMHYQVEVSADGKRITIVDMAPSAQVCTSRGGVPPAAPPAAATDTTPARAMATEIAPGEPLDGPAPSDEQVLAIEKAPAEKTVAPPTVSPKEEAMMVVPRIPCTFIRPICPCDEPKTPEPPPPPVRITTKEAPPAATTPEAPVAMCRWGDMEAVLLKTGVSIPLAKPCEPLEKSVYTSESARKLYHVADEYYNNPKPDTLAKVSDALADQLGAETGKDEQLPYGMALMRLSENGSDAGATVENVDAKAWHERFVKKDMAMVEGRLIINSPDAMSMLSTSPTASLSNGGTETAAPVNLFKDMTMVQTLPPVLLTLDMATMKGGGTPACALAVDAPDLPNSSFGTLMAAILALLSWRFLPRGRRG